MLMTKLNIVWLNVHYQIIPMEVIKQINVFKCVLILNMPKILQECVYHYVLLLLLPTIMFEYVLQFVQLLLIYMEIRQTIHANKCVLRVRIYMETILRDYVYLNVLIHYRILLQTL